MSKTKYREIAPSDGGSAEQRLARLLNTSPLAHVVPRLAPETLHELVQQRGLDACGELVTFATPSQLTALLDLDLWRHAPPGAFETAQGKRDEQFDADRFGEWLEVLVDAGDSVAARTVAALDTHLVVVGLCRYVRVFDPGTFEPTAQSDDELMDRDDLMNSETSRDVVECEVGGYLVRARRTDAWDAIVALLVALETEHASCFHTLMSECRRLSNSSAEVDGLDDLLTAPEQHLYEVVVERQHRLAQQGYATPAEARAFLQLARRAQHNTARPNTSIAASPIAMAGPRAGKLPALARMMEGVRRHDEAAFGERGRELVFLANTLMAGCSIQSRPFTPQEASEAAACVCNLGIECWPEPSSTLLAEHTLVTMFEAGWGVLHQDVSMFAASELIATLTKFHGVDGDTALELRTLGRALERHCKTGMPWLAREAADVLAILDMTAWISVLGLLDECPILPATLTAVLDARTTPVSPTAFAFISTAAQIGDVRLFMRMLPGLLSA